MIKFRKLERDQNALKDMRVNVTRIQLYIDRIKYNISQASPISHKSLLFFIPMLYDEKLLDNLKREMDGMVNGNFDIFFYDYMKNKFKLEKLVRKHIEETLLAIRQYSSTKILIILLNVSGR